MKKVALVTGSSRGIGRAIARELSDRGWAVCINCVERVDMAESLREEILAAGGQAVAVRADVSDLADVERMVGRTREELGEISLLVNNAGIARQSQFQDITPEYWRRIFAVNVNGAFNTIKATLPAMLRAHSGCIVNISSVWGLRGASCESAYCATKHAVIGLTRSLAAELGPTGIRVNCVAPGVIDTDMVKVLGEETLDELACATPLGRLGTPRDIAAAVAFLADDGASFITGQVLTSDGGFNL